MATTRLWRQGRRLSPRSLGEQYSAARCRRVAGALDRLLPPQPLDREVELPPEWFKYPPI